MTQLTHVFVTVPEGRLVPIPASEATAAGGELLKAEPGKLYAVKWSTFTRKRVAGGDFVLANKNGKHVTTPTEATAPANTRAAPDGSVDPDQRSDEEIAKGHTKPAPKFDTSDTGKDR